MKVDFPKGRLIAVTGVSGSGKTALIMESLIPAIEALCKKEKLPEHIQNISAEGISQIKLIDSALVPKAAKDCVNCGLCAEGCPAQAISRENLKTADAKKCISCMRCVVKCPKSARK